MASESYTEYLASPHWRTVRQRKLDEQGNRCERCGTFARRILGGGWYGLDVHHLTYERRGAELLSDLEVLCFACHAAEHGVKPKRTPGQVVAGRTTCSPITDEIDDEVAAWDTLVSRAGL